MKRRRMIQCDRLTLPKGLTRAAAERLAHKKLRKDYRAFTYDSKTGKASMT